MAQRWSLKNEGQQLLTNTIVTTSVQGNQLLQDHRQLMICEGVLREAGNCRTQVEADIVDQCRIRDTTTLTIDNLENCLQTIMAAETSAANNHAESQDTVGGI